MSDTRFSYNQILANGLFITNLLPQHAGKLEALQRIVFPSLAEDELILEKHYLHHYKIFPEGQFVILDGDEVVGMTTTMRCDFDFDNHQHTFKDTISGGWMHKHNPNGQWLYGLDVGVHPDYRGKGLARELYRARQNLVVHLKLKGQLTVGLMSGFGAVSHQFTGEEYYQQLLQDQRSDPTLGPQLKIGFKPLALIKNYVNDPSCGNYGVLLQLDIQTII
ncbi:MAG: GNAT family N-acetyltransferase [Sphingobacteriales bacterium]|nr:MAG: GNAT family N-acetyltransferase [Sphingobacteriales bacterium]